MSSGYEFFLLLMVGGTESERRIEEETLGRDGVGHGVSSGAERPGDHLARSWHFMESGLR